jgi:cysteine desulfurase
MSEIVYFDHAATTPVRPEVRDAMSPFLSSEAYGNPSSGHRAGREAQAALDRARSRIADALGCAAGHVIFTSGGTEADNLAVLGTALRAHLEGRAFRAIVARTEHKAILDAAGAVERLGGEAVLLDVDRTGQIAMDAYRDALARGAAVASVMWVNNETGVTHDVVGLAELARDAGVPFHTDAVQAVGKVPSDLGGTAIALASISGHKLGAPKGIGALIMRVPDLIEPLIHGGGQQGGVRPGTENVAGAVGLGEAVALAVAERPAAMERVRDLKRLLAAELTAAVPGLEITDTADGAPHILHVTIPEIDGSALLTHLDQAGIACSTGSACASGRVGPSHVLVAMGTAHDWNGSALRLSLAPTTTRADVDALLRRMPDVIDRVRVLTAALRGET